MTRANKSVDIKWNRRKIFTNLDAKYYQESAIAVGIIKVKYTKDLGRTLCDTLDRIKILCTLNAETAKKFPLIIELFLTNSIRQPVRAALCLSIGFGSALLIGSEYGWLSLTQL